jgi:hypothetical protein
MRNKPWDDDLPLIFRLVPVFIGVVFVLIVCWWIFVAVMGVKLAKSLEGCEPAVITKTENGETSTSIGCK